MTEVTISTGFLDAKQRAKLDFHETELYFPSSRCFFSSEHAAEQNFTSGEEDTFPCYSDGRSKAQIEGRESSSFEVSTQRVRVIFTICASAITGICVLYIIFHMIRFHKRRGRVRQHAEMIRLRGSNLPNAPHEILTSRGAKRPLGGTEARMLIEMFRENTTRVEGICAICLEELDVEDGRAGVCLPCSHPFHEECVLQWFRKGSATCPNCNGDLGDEVRKLREGSGSLEGVVGSGGRTEGTETEREGSVVEEVEDGVAVGRRRRLIGRNR